MKVISVSADPGKVLNFINKSLKSCQGVISDTVHSEPATQETCCMLNFSVSGVLRLNNKSVS